MVQKVVVKTEGSGIRDRFLKDASWGTCCAARRRARRKSAARAVKRNDHRGGGAGLTGVAGKIAGGGEKRKEVGAEKGMSTNRIDSLSRAGTTSLYCRPDRAARSHPFCFFNPALFIYQPSYIMGDA